MLLKNTSDKSRFDTVYSLHFAQYHTYAIQIGHNLGDTLMAGGKTPVESKTRNLFLDTILHDVGKWGKYDV